MSATAASVISTGGGGNDFERRVGAYFLALLLTKSFTPLFSDSAPVRVHFQARRLGWQIDDLVVETRSEAGQTHKIAAQVKRTFTLSSSDEECKKTLTAAWQDFNNVALFQQGRDAIVLVTYLGTNRIQHDVRWLVGQARAAGTAADFLARRQGQGTLNKQAKADYETIKAILDDANGAPVADESVWRFLQVFHILSFDFQDAAAKDEASILSILATLRSQDAEIDAAATSWSELIDFAGLAATEGRSVELATLPERARNRHRQVPSSKHGELARLHQHSSTTLRRITAAGPQGIVFERAETRKELEEAVAEHQIVLVVGPAGSGKSILGMNFLTGAAISDTNFAFAAEEFKAAHIDQVLANANLNLTWQELDGLLPLHRKTFFVDGLERLLEASDRAAFKDLLLAVKDDSTISLVITCRDYYAEVVERSLLATGDVAFAKVVVGGLSDAELAQAEAAAPVLTPLLANPTLRPILRNPFLLTRAAQLRLRPGEPIPQTERALRRRMWSDLIRNDAFVADGMPAKREMVFFDVCVTRARALRPYVNVADVDGALQRLANDNLLASDEERRVAAAHDVFEDWGLVEWFTRRFDEHAGSAARMVDEVGGHPALRRAYRKWLTEQLDVDSALVSGFVAEVSASTGIPSHFVDDTWLAVFQSQAAGAFMSTFAETLLADDAFLLQRVLHLVRVGCKTVSPMSQNVEVSLRWHVPVGTAWSILLQFMAEHWTRLPRRMDSLLVAFMEDWAVTVSASDPLPAGAVSVGALIEKLLARPTVPPGPLVPRERLVELLMKIPRANETLFKSIALRASAVGSIRDDEDARHFAKVAFEPFKAVAFADAFPVELQALCRGRWFLSEDREPWNSAREVETVFGLAHSYEHRFFPPSSMQGPLFFLLRSHVQDGVRFIVDFVNQCCTKYQESSAYRDTIEPPYEVDLTLSDGTVRKVLCNQRMWQAYRATSVMPGVIECALMALESRLLEMARRGASPEVFQSYLNYILRESNNVATLGVVASVCIAHPTLAGESAVSILGSAELIRMDVARMMADQSALAVGGYDLFSRAFQSERMESRALPHRKLHLEWLAMQLQLGPIKAAVHALLDRYVSELPSEDARSSHQSQWMLALRRMDLRTYDLHQVGDRVEFTMGALPSDVQAMVKGAEAGQQEFMRKIELQNWGHRNREQAESDGNGLWRQKLELAKQAEADIAARGSRDILEGGGRMVAAAIARDYWAELGTDDRTWCLATIDECLREDYQADEDFFRGSIPVDGSMECAGVLGAVAPLLPPSAAENLIVMGLTHSNRHVQMAAIQSLTHDAFWRSPTLLNFALHVLVADATVSAAQYVRSEALPWNQRPSAAILFQQRQAEMLAANKAAWGAAPPGLDAQLLRQEPMLATFLITLFQPRSGHPIAVQVFTWVAEQFPRWWDRHHEDQDQDFELHHSARTAFAEFLIASEPVAAGALLAPVLAQVQSEPREFARLVEDMIVAADQRGDATTFWSLWSHIATEAKNAQWFASLSDDRSWGGELVRSLFLQTSWTEGLREWKHLGSSHRDIDALFMALPAGSLMLEAFVRYLLKVGKASLPGAVNLIHAKFGVQLEQALKSSNSAKTSMDQLVSRLMFEDLPALQAPALRGAMLAILDALVQAGSSNAFLLREDFLTPSGGAGR